MSLDNVRYDAFISYRHSETDKFNAMSIQKKLENFKLPKSLYKKTAGGKTRIERVFRDQDELPLASNLSDPIEVALKNSEFLIVICTPRLPESKWCAKEIETFIALHGRERVLAVLAEGEPEQSFPESLRFVRKVVIDGQGNRCERLVEIEPLAADTRGATAKERKKQIDDAVLRLAAPIFGLNYDDLKQRHKEQRTKRILTVAAVVAAVFFIFAMVCMGLAFRINSQKNTIEDQYAEIEANNREITAQNKEIKEQNGEILRQSEEITRQNEEIGRQYRAEQIKYAGSMADASAELYRDGRKLDALYAIRHAMPSQKNDADIPYTPAAEAALTEALGIFDRDEIIVPVNAMNLVSSPKQMEVSSDRKHLLVIDAAGYCYVFNTETGKEEYRSFRKNASEIRWIDNDSFIIGNYSGLAICSLTTGQEKSVGESTSCFALNADHTILATVENDFWQNTVRLKEYDLTKEGMELLSMDIVTGETASITIGYSKLEISPDGSHAMFFSEKLDDVTLEYVSTMYLTAVEPDGVISDGTASFTHVTDAHISDDRAYVLVSSSSDYIHYDATIYELDYSGEVLNSDTYTDSYLHNFDYVATTNPCLVLDGRGVMLVLDAYSLEKLSDQRYDNELVHSRNVLNDNYFVRLMITSDGSITMYNSLYNQNIDYSGRFYKNKSVREVAEAVSSGDDFYLSYDAENYVAQFKLSYNGAYLSTPADEMFKSGSYLRRDFYKDYSLCIQTESSDDGYVHSLYDLRGAEPLCTVEDENLQVVIPDGRTDTFITYGKTVIIYDCNGNVTNSMDTGSYSSKSDMSCDGGCIMSRNYTTNAIEVFSTVDFSKIGQIEGIDFSEKLYISAKSGKLIAVNDEAISSYDIKTGEQVARLPFSSSFISAFVLSDDGKYLFAVSKNNKLDIYDTGKLEFVTAIYDLDVQPEQVKYIEALEGYLFIASSGKNRLTDCSFETFANAYDCVAFREDEQCFIIYGENIYKLPYVPYEEMIKRADELLGDYEPSDYIREKYHI